jgi:hypothetical protein
MKLRVILAFTMLLGVLLLLYAPAAAEVYKWVDENGVVHYSERPPGDRQSSELAIPTEPEPKSGSAADKAAGPTSSWYDQWLAEQRERKRLERVEREQQSAERGAEQAHMLEVCAEARQRLEVLETPCRAFFDGRGVLRSWCAHQGTWAYRGEYRFIEDDERADMIRHYREQLAECEAAGY